VRRVRIGIDVGGTFTKAVAVETRTGAIVARSVVPTTHGAPTGVAEGILESLSEILSGGEIDPSEVELISHSTTQAINALLESDTARVGVVAMGVGPERREVTRRTSLRGGDGAVRAEHAFLDTSRLLTAGDVDGAIAGLRERGAEVILAAEAFAVDDPSNEVFVMEGAARAGLPATASHEVSGAYGLEIRATTAAMNASVLPTAARVAGHVERAIRDLGVGAPLMIMRGDGGVTSMETFRTRPILTVLSGPAASVAGALLHLRVADGIFIEVGGTSTNICVIRAGRPEVRYVTIQGRPTCVRSLDVRVVGSAGGSMVRRHPRGKWTAGPRSAHIAGLRYACHADAAELRAGELTHVRPTPNDEGEYAAIRCEGGTYAITNTCAANALGMVPEGDYARSGQEAARAAMELLGAQSGTPYSEVARSIIQTSSFGITKEVSRIMKEYSMDRRATSVIGAGGGASVLAPFVAKQLGLGYRRAENAEVISSIGAASSMLQEAAEVSMASPTPEAIHGACRAAHSALVARGAVPESVIVDTEHDAERGILRVSATGSVELDSAGPPHSVFTLEEARSRAAEVMRLPAGLVDLTFESDSYMVFTGRARKRRVLGTRVQRRALVLDRYGRAKLSLGDAVVLQGGRNSILEELAELHSRRPSPVAARTYLVDDMRLVDYSALTDGARVLDAARSELGDARAAVIVEA